MQLTHWEKRMRELAQSPIQQATVAFYSSLLESFTAARVLDLGAGSGLVAAKMAEQQNVAEVVAYDANLDAMRLLKERTKIRKECGGSYRALPFPKEMFDAVICRYTLHHLEDKNVALMEMKRVLRPDGTLLISDAVLPEHSRNTLAGIYRIREDHYNGYVTYYELITLLEDVGLQPLLIRPYRYIYPTLSKYLEAVENGMDSAIEQGPKREMSAEKHTIAQVLQWKIRRAFFAADDKAKREMSVVFSDDKTDLSFKYFMVDVAATRSVDQ